MSVDPDLVRGWLAGRSLARRLPAPIAEGGGWRVDTGGEEERRRYVFARATPGLIDVAERVAEPRIFVKLCADAGTLRDLLPPRWSVLPSNCMMVCAAAVRPAAPLPCGYALHTAIDGRVAHVTIVDRQGDIAAEGYAAEADGAFVYDRIATAEAHRRRGLGRALMAALHATRRDAASREVLTATPMGRALYESVGWRLYAPYTTAVIPDP